MKFLISKGNKIRFSPLFVDLILRQSVQCAMFPLFRNKGWPPRDRVGRHDDVAGRGPGVGRRGRGLRRVLGQERPGRGGRLPHRGQRGQTQQPQDERKEEEETAQRLQSAHSYGQLDQSHWKGGLSTAFPLGPRRIGLDHRFICFGVEHFEFSNKACFMCCRQNIFVSYNHWISVMWYFMLTHTNCCFMWYFMLVHTVVSFLYKNCTDIRLSHTIGAGFQFVWGSMYRIANYNCTLSKALDFNVYVLYFCE